MSRKLLLSIGLLVAISICGLPARAAQSNLGNPILFDKTNHTLAYSFRVFWEQNGGLPIFGYPLSEVFIQDDLPVQYFERARFEWHAQEATVMLTQLGRLASLQHSSQPAFAPVAPGNNQTGQDYFVETKHSLSHGFKTFWHNNGGLPVFGYPLSEEFQEVNAQDGLTYTVQYFERARFEYHPNNPLAYQVELGQLGRQYLGEEQPVLPAQALAPVTDPGTAWNSLRPTHIKMARIKLDADITEEGNFSFQGWSVPRYTAAHYWPVSGWPGTAGNIVLAGHAGYKNFLFNNLPQAAIGDEISLMMGQDERHYSVTQILTLLPTDSWIMAPTVSETLTLITCVPLNIFDHRLIVRAVPLKPK